jgi:hypothetical protein
VEYLRIEAVGGGVLLAATIAALALTYSPAADAHPAAPNLRHITA